MLVQPLLQSQVALSATMGMAETSQSPCACSSSCCVPAVNSSSLIVLQLPVSSAFKAFPGGGERMGMMCLMTLISDQEDVL